MGIRQRLCLGVALLAGCRQLDGNGLDAVDAAIDAPDAADVGDAPSDGDADVDGVMADPACARVETMSAPVASPVGSPRDELLDHSFGVDGIVDVRSLFAPASPGITDIAISATGEIAVIGRVGAWFETFVCRLDATGAMDPQFGGDGCVTLWDGSVDPPRTMGGKLTFVGDDLIVAVLRLTASGQISTFIRIGPTGASASSFGTGGTLDLALGDTTIVESIVENEGGAIVSASVGTGASSAGWLAELSSVGELRAVQQSVARCGARPFMGDVVLTANGALATGSAWPAGGFIVGSDRALAPDAAFGFDGFLLLGGSSPARLQTLPDGRVLSLAGNALRRLSSTGASDATFGAEGVVIAPANELWIDMAALDDGRTAVLGVVSSDADASLTYTIVRILMSDGSIDTSFASNGRLAFATAVGDSYPLALLKQTGNRLVIGGGQRLVRIAL
jgi:hypothetical protein